MKAFFVGLGLKPSFCLTRAITSSVAMCESPEGSKAFQYLFSADYHTETHIRWMKTYLFRVPYDGLPTPHDGSNTRANVVF